MGEPSRHLTGDRCSAVFTHRRDRKRSAPLRCRHLSTKPG